MGGNGLLGRRYLRSRDDKVRIACSFSEGVFEVL